jgi:hypothetical protein
MPAMSSHLSRLSEEDPQEIICNTPWGDIPVWKYATLTCGDVGAYSDYLRTVRSDAASAEAAITAADARADELEEREANLERREGELNARVTLFNDAVSRFADMVSKQCDRRRDEEEEQELETLMPGGELHTVPPKGDDAGDLPEEIERGTPSGNYTFEEPEPPQVSQPVSVSLNNIEDDDNVS